MTETAAAAAAAAERVWNDKTYYKLSPYLLSSSSNTDREYAKLSNDVLLDNEGMVIEILWPDNTVTAHFLYLSTTNETFSGYDRDADWNYSHTTYYYYPYIYLRVNGYSVPIKLLSAVNNNNNNNGGLFMRVSREKHPYDGMRQILGKNIDNESADDYTEEMSQNYKEERNEKAPYILSLSEEQDQYPRVDAPGLFPGYDLTQCPNARCGAQITAETIENEQTYENVSKANAEEIRDAKRPRYYHKRKILEEDHMNDFKICPTCQKSKIWIGGFKL